VSHLIELWSILLTVANSGKSWRLASPAGAAMLFHEVLRLGDVALGHGLDCQRRLSFTMKTAISGWRVSPMKRTME